MSIFNITFLFKIEIAKAYIVYKFVIHIYYNFNIIKTTFFVAFTIDLRLYISILFLY